MTIDSEGTEGAQLRLDNTLATWSRRAHAIASDPIAAYISQNYRVCKMLSSPDGWRFHFMVRKDATCPQ